MLLPLQAALRTHRLATLKQPPPFSPIPPSGERCHGHSMRQSTRPPVEQHAGPQAVRCAHQYTTAPCSVPPYLGFPKSASTCNRHAGTGVATACLCYSRMNPAAGTSTVPQGEGGGGVRGLHLKQSDWLGVGCCDAEPEEWKQVRCLCQTC